MSDRDKAEAHVTWYMDNFRRQFMAFADLMEILLIDNFEHGMKHGRQLEQEKINDAIEKGIFKKNNL